MDKENENFLITEKQLAQDEIKNFKENLLDSVANGNNPVTNDSELNIPQSLRPRSSSTARDALCIPATVMSELDDSKIFELKEAFLLFDMNGDGYIDQNDLRGTFVSLGETVDEQLVRNMLSEASQPLDFDAFVNLLGYKTLELDSEETLKAALSRWDAEKSGYISEERIRHDLMTWGDRFTEKETDYALDEAPTIDKNGKTMIDYIQFCSQLSGLRKAKK
ncbi:unnamed protein product [Parnassius apollo]|uniref:(apollo) hypothetical protein n=1 Tax=Parnassius apollo TaxID=110799 RepID=A0A8S3Y1N4_PARAO|nr:unnamed protein product [Parnassius apollo]